MYQALYRKWRPRTFDDVVGQEHIVETLRNELLTGKLAHAYLFTGSRGTGKTTLAKIFAKAVNCLNPSPAGPCLTCELCRGIDDGTVLDVVEQDAASNNGVDSVRALKEETSFTPVHAKYRVYILDEAHMLSIAAVNALLKIMEEPPPHVIFILATTEVHKIPETLMSRCQRFDFKRLTSDQIVGRLSKIAEAEGANLRSGAAERIASLVNGGMRDAIGLLDQAMAVSMDISPETVDEVAGVADREHLFRLAEAVRTGDSGAIFEIIDELYQRSFDVDRLCGDLHTWFRDLMLVKTCRNPSGLVSVPTDLPRLTAQAEGFSLAALLHSMSALQQAQLALTRAVSARAELETCLLKLTDPRLDDSPEAIVRRLEAIESRLRGQAAVQTTPAVPIPAPSPKPHESVPAATDEPRFAVPSFVREAAGTQPSAKPVSPSQTAVPSPVPDSSPEPEPPPSEPSVYAPETISAPAAEPAAAVAARPGSSADPSSNSQETAAPPAPHPERPLPRNAAEASAVAARIPETEWSEIVAAVGRTNMPLCGALFGSKGYLSGSLVLIEGSSFFLKMIREDPNAKSTLKAALLEHYGQPCGIGPYTPPAEVETPKDRFERLASTAASMGIALENADDGSKESIL